MRVDINAHAGKYPSYTKQHFSTSPTKVYFSVHTTLLRCENSIKLT